MKHTIVILSLALAMGFAAFAQAPATQQHKVEKLSNQHLLALITSARTPSEHLRIARYYEAKAQEYLAQSRDHEEQAEAYKKNPVTSNSKFAVSTVDHCEYFAQTYKDMAAKMQDLAQMHEQMARDAEKK